MKLTIYVSKTVYLWKAILSIHVTRSQNLTCHFLLFNCYLLYDLLLLLLYDLLQKESKAQVLSPSV